MIVEQLLLEPVDRLESERFMSLQVARLALMARSSRTFRRDLDMEGEQSRISISELAGEDVEVDVDSKSLDDWQEFPWWPEDFRQMC